MAPIPSPAYIENADKRMQTNFMIPDIKETPHSKSCFIIHLFLQKYR
jgi:hypothetical protein